MGMKFCVTTYTTQNMILPEDFIPKLAEWGYDGIELWGARAYQPNQPKWGLEGRTDAEIKKLKKLAEKHNLEVPAVSTYFRFTSNEEDYEKSLQTGRRYCEIAKSLGAKLIRVVGEGVPSANMTEDKWKVFIKGLKELAALGDEYDVTFGLELHPSTPHDTVLGQLRCVWQTDSQRIRVLYQPPTIALLEPELDQMWALGKLFPYIAHVHLDSDVPFEQSTLISQKTGHVHWTQILAEMKRRGFSGYVSIEGAAKPVLESLQREIRWLKQFA